ncbi:hypothetical protein CN059_29790 [Sinorhizobium medicae]|nr:hypothetical protein CN059_29790 [Sinorhizobium medicae]
MRFMNDAWGLEHFRFSPNRGNSLTLCIAAIPDGKPLHTFPGIALAQRAFAASGNDLRTKSWGNSECALARR